MADIQSWGELPRVIDGKTTFSAADMNIIIAAIEGKLNVLRNSINSDVTKVGYTITDTGFAEGVDVGDLVFVDTDGIYKKASASFALDKLGYGQQQAAASSYPVGIVIDKLGDSATILCSGWVYDDAVCAKYTNTGRYYLGHNGSMTQQVDMLAPIVPCAVRSVSGKIYINIMEPLVVGHTHGYTEIPISSFDSNNVFSPAADDVAYALLQFDTAVVVANGVILDNKVAYEIDTDNRTIKLLKQLPPSITTIKIYSVNPLVDNATPVRGIRIKEGNNLLSLSKNAGVVELNTNLTTTTADTTNGTCVQSIDDSGVKTAPVINSIEGAAGIYVTTTNGVCSISAKDTLKTVKDMQLVNVNNAVVGGDTNGVFFSFLANTKGSITGTIRVPYYTDNAVTF